MYVCREDSAIFRLDNLKTAQAESSCVKFWGLEATIKLNLRVAKNHRSNFARERGARPSCGKYSRKMKRDLSMTRLRMVGSSGYKYNRRQLSLVWYRSQITLP